MNNQALHSAAAFVKIFSMFSLALRILLGLFLLAQNESQPTGPTDSSPASAVEQQGLAESPGEPEMLPTAKGKTKKKNGLMGRSKQDIELILSKFMNKEGAMIRNIHWISNNKYSVELYTKSRACFRHDLLIERKKQTVIFDKRFKPCG